VIEPGVLLSWLPPSPDSTVQDFVVYGTDSTSNTGFVRRAVTTSVSFHDAGTPMKQYYVTSQDVNGTESHASNLVVIDPSDTVQTPANLTGTPLNAAALLAWQDNSITGANGSHFDFYRVYSDSVDNSNACVAASTVLEGQSVSAGFVITGLANGTPRCYFATAVTRSGHESAGSNGVIITPSSADPPYTAARVPANFTIITHHPIALHRARAK
jgi:hypothetical protein